MIAASGIVEIEAKGIVVKGMSYSEGWKTGVEQWQEDADSKEEEFDK